MAAQPQPGTRQGWTRGVAAVPVPAQIPWETHQAEHQMVSTEEKGGKDSKEQLKLVGGGTHK